LECEDPVSVSVTEDTYQRVREGDLVGVQTRRSRALYLFLWMKIMKIVNYGQDIFTTEDLMSSYESKIHY
jgi:hypothetical protein